MVKKKSKLKQSKMVNEDVQQVRNLVILLFIVILACVGIYFLTNKMIEKESKNAQSNDEVSINYDIATVGTMFNRVENEYYVLLYSSENDGDNLDSVLATYRSSDNYVKTYYIDLDLKINSNVLGDDLVSSPKNSSEVKVKGATLYKIKDGSVVKCISGVDKIIDELK